MAGKQTTSNWKMKKVLPSQRSPSNLLRLASSFNYFWCCYASMWPCVSSKPKEVAFVVQRENSCQLELLQRLWDLKDNKCTLRSRWLIYVRTKRMLFTFNTSDIKCLMTVQCNAECIAENQCSFYQPQQRYWFCFPLVNLCVCVC